MKRLSTYLLAGIALLSASCSDFLDTAPKDALSPATTWKTETDAESFVVGCYNGLLDPSSILYLDCGSDIGYNNFSWEGWRPWGDGSLSSGNTGASFYDFAIIRRCNTVLENIDNVEFTTAGKKEELIAEAKAIRAYRYFIMNWWYAGVPIIGSYTTAEEAQVPRNTEAEVREQIAQDLDDALTAINTTPAARGRIAKGAVLATKMREALYYGDWQKAKDAAQAIIDLKQYELDSDYENLFKLTGVDSKEIILSDQRLESVFGLGVIGQMYNNDDAGWSSIVPTQNLVDMYEMDNGLTKEEATGYYDAKHPFANRDPRMDMTILYPGQEWRGKILNTPACVIIFRYAEVLLSWAEAENELNGPSDQVYNYIDQIRERVGMPKVVRTKYDTQDKLRELIRRERCVEFAGEGLRRADILRWKDAGGKMLAETLMNGDLKRITGAINYSENDPYKRAEVTGTATIETRKFAPKNRYLPFSQTDVLDKNPNIKQNPGY